MPAAMRQPEYPGSGLIKSLQNWRKQEPSVMDAWWEAPAKKAVDVLDFVTPSQTDVITTQVPGVPITPLISIFANKAARLAANAEMRNSFKALTNGIRMASSPIPEALPKIADRIDASVERFANKYPRIAAHMRASQAILPGTSNAGVVLGPGRVKDPIKMAYGQRGFENILENPKSADEYMFHEGTHVAHALGNADSHRLYDLSEYLHPGDKVESYLSNPFEQHAFEQGFKAGGYKNPAPRPIYEKLNESLAAAKYTLKNNPKSNTPGNILATNNLEEILTRRGQLNLPTTEELVKKVTRPGKFIKNYKALEKFKKGEEPSLRWYHKDVEPEETEIQKILKKTQGFKTAEPNYKDFDFQKWFNRENKRKLEEEARKIPRK